MRFRPKQSRFNVGVLNAALLAADDLEQYGAALLEAENCYLRPEGGVRRRPGTYRCEEATARFRVVEFKFARGQEYLFLLLSRVLWVIADGVKISEVTTPWDAVAVADLDWDSELDSTVFTHTDYHPRRLVRGLLDVDPITFAAGSTAARVRHPNHRAVTGDHVGFSGLTGAAGITAAQLARSFQLTLIGGSLGADPVTVFAAETRVRVAMPAHTFAAGQRVKFTGLLPVGDVPSSQLNRAQLLTAVDPAWVEFDQAIVASEEVTGGGTDGAFEAPDDYSIVLPVAATASLAGGGSGGRAWLLTQPEHKNIPIFDFDDEASPAATDEEQILTFSNFAEDDRYKLLLDRESTPKISYHSADAVLNVQAIAEALHMLGWGVDPNWGITLPERLSDVEVSHLDGEPGGIADRYLVRFVGAQGGRDWPLLGWEISRSKLGEIGVEEHVPGGRRVEPVWSDTRGWPRRVAFHRQRTIYGGSRSRPQTRWGSKIGVPFDFDVGDALAAEALNDTLSGSGKKIVALVSTDRLVLLTESNAVVEFDGQAGAVTPETAGMREQNAYGAADVRPIRMGGSVLYTDVRGGAIRELAYSFEADKYVAPDIAALSSDLIRSPVVMVVHRVVKGDYALVVNADGSAALLTRNAEQQVSGWTPWSTDGRIFAAASAGDWLYLGVERLVQGQPRFFLERLWDPSKAEAYAEEIFVDCAVRLVGPRTTWTGLDHLEGRSVELVADGAYIGSQVVVAGQVTTDEEWGELVVGLAYDWKLVPMPSAAALPAGGTGTQVVRVLGGLIDLQASAGVLVNGFPIADRTFGDRALEEPPPLLEGLYRFRCRGWGRRKNVTVTQGAPGPVTVRAIEPWIAYGGAG